MRWSPDRQQLLADLSAAGLSAGDIAILLDDRRNAVASAMYRYGLFAVTRRRSSDAVAVTVAHLSGERQS
jgi:hypothetical protein